jgi:Na+/phosphate symporter
MLITWLSLLIAIVGLLVFGLTKQNPDVKEIGRIMFFCGLLAFLLALPGKAITLLH